jgi:DNA-binding MarR family transcriptional regulator
MVNSDPQIGYSLKRAQSLLHTRMEEALAPLALTVTQYSCLFRIRQEAGISSAGLARATFVTRQSMNATLQQLVDRDLVSRPSAPESGRALPTRLTPAGDAALNSAGTLIDGVERRMLAGLTPDQQAALASALQSCVTSLER